MQDFIVLKRSLHGLAWQPEIVGRRVISWLSNSVLILDSGEPEAYANFLRALTSQLRYLSASYRDAPDGVPRLVALMALIYAGLCIAEQQAVVDRYARPFGKELDRQILPDGGHISRNPEALVELLLDLLPLRQCFVARDRAPPKELTDAIDRIMPMLRFFRTGDGTLARFNGVGPTPTDALATVLAYDDVEGAPVRSATNSGYVRLERGPTLLICRHRRGAGAVGQHPRACGLSRFRDELGQLSDYRQLRHALDRPRRLDSVRPLDAGAFDAELRGHLIRRFAATGASGSQLAPIAAAAARSTRKPRSPTEGDNLRIKGSHDGYATRFRRQPRAAVRWSRRTACSSPARTTLGARADSKPDGRSPANMPSASICIRPCARAWRPTGKAPCSS